MDYIEACCCTVSKAEALHELKKHGITHKTDLDLFYHELGNHSEYDGGEVLGWLGY